MCVRGLEEIGYERCKNTCHASAAGGRPASSTHETDRHHRRPTGLDDDREGCKPLQPLRKFETTSTNSGKCY